jgi:C4-dicarboxylate-specific signal transduction histidine kinase
MVRRYFVSGLTPASVNGFHFLGLTESNYMSIYPTELIAKAEFEMRTFERVSQETGKELLNEVKSLRTELQKMKPINAVAIDRENLGVMLHLNLDPELQQSIPKILECIDSFDPIQKPLFVKD